MKTLAPLAVASLLICSACDGADDDRTTEPMNTNPVQTGAPTTGGAPTSDAMTTDSTQRTREFIGRVSQSNMLEIQSSQAAEESAQREDVRAFARMMVTDHTQMGQRLREAVPDMQSQIPLALDAKHAAQLQTLTQSGTTELDSRYLDLQEELHTDAIALLQSYANEGDNSALKEFASTSLPTIRTHLDRLRQISGQTDGATGSVGDTGGTPAP